MDKICVENENESRSQLGRSGLAQRFSSLIRCKFMGLQFHTQYIW